MKPQREVRRLTTILAADVVGYSRLMGEDETGTLGALKAHRKELFDPKTAQYRGRTIKLMGDGALMEFASVVDAVAFAVEVQCAMGNRNADVPEDKRITYRIGINIGDIIVEGDDIYGDGVNIASRIEGLAEPGGICIARNAYNQVKGKVDLNFEHLGEKEVKNIAEPVSVYRVLIDEAAAALITPVTARADRSRRVWSLAVAAAVVLVVAMGGALWWQPWAPDVEPASAERMALPLPDKPSIAVLAFDNMSDDSSQEYFADGIAEDIITDLSKISGLFVIARNSSFTYKGKPVKVRQVAEDLGVRYVLEGSVRRSGDRVRITAQLIDTSTGGHLWGERYDRELVDIFALQDEISEKVVTALKVRLTESEQEQVGHRYTDNVEAYDLYLRGREHQLRGTKGYDQAKQLFEQAIELDPEFAAAYAELSFAHWEFLKVKGQEQAFEAAQKAVALDDSLPLAHTRLAWAYLRKRQHEQAIRQAKRAIELDPNFAEGYSILGEILNSAGRPEEGIGFVEKAMRLDPHYPASYLFRLGQSYYMMGQNQKAIVIFERARDRNPDDKPPHMHLIILYAEEGQMDKAQAEIESILALIPNESVELEEKICAYATGGPLERFLDGLRKAKLPEKSRSDAT